MDYRFRVISSEAAANGDVHLDVWMDKETSEDVWEAVPNGHRTLVLDGEAVLAITGGAGTDGEKRTALLALFKAEVENWGADTADDANTQMTALLPGGDWPVTVAL